MLDRVGNEQERLESHLRGAAGKRRSSTSSLFCPVKDTGSAAGADPPGLHRIPARVFRDGCPDRTEPAGDPGPPPRSPPQRAESAARR